VISTNEVNKDPISSGVFRRISTRTGGKAYWAKTWQKQVEAFEAIREDLGTSCRAGDPVPELEAGKIGDHRERSRLTVDGPANVVRGERPYDGHAI